MEGLLELTLDNVVVARLRGGGVLIRDAQRPGRFVMLEHEEIGELLRFLREQDAATPQVCHATSR